MCFFIALIMLGILSWIAPVHAPATVSTVMYAGIWVLIGLSGKR